jgi:hypothetical protein
MTIDEAVEKCTKAWLREQKQPEHIWRESPESLEFARRLVISLRELDLLKLDEIK